MFIIYFLLWVILNERLTAEIAILGAVISMALYLFTVKFMDYSPKREWAAIRKIPRALKYVFFLIKEIVLSNFHVIHFILSPRYEVEPQLVYFKTKLTNEIDRVVLANSITLTPGTITVSAEKNLMCVHCLDKSLSEGLENSTFEQKLLDLEAMDKSRKDKEATDK